VGQTRIVRGEEAVCGPPVVGSRQPENEVVPRQPLNHRVVDEANPEPAGFPAAIVRRLGRGVAVHIPTDFFDIYWRYGYPDLLAWLREILDRLQPGPLFHTDAPACVEVALRKKDAALLVHFVNGNPGRDLSHVNAKDLWVDDIPALGPITSWIRCAQKPGQATWEPGGKYAQTKWDNGALEFVLPRLEIHTCLKLEKWVRP